MKSVFKRRNNSSNDSADFAQGYPHFCSEMLPFSGAENTPGLLILFSPPGTHFCALFLFFWSSHHFLLSPFLSHSRDPNKTSSSRITVGSDCSFVDMEMRRVDLQLWIPVVLSIKHVGTHTESERTQRSDASRTAAWQIPSLLCAVVHL